LVGYTLRILGCCLDLLLTFSTYSGRLLAHSPSRLCPLEAAPTAHPTVPPTLP
jgi:hypothetical protein